MLTVAEEARPFPVTSRVAARPCPETTSLRDRDPDHGVLGTVGEGEGHPASDWHLTLLLRVSYCISPLLLLLLSVLLFAFHIHVHARTGAHTQARTHTGTRTHTRARAHTHTHSVPCPVQIL